MIMISYESDPPQSAIDAAADYLSFGLAAYGIQTQCELGPRPIQVIRYFADDKVGLFRASGFEWCFLAFVQNKTFARVQVSSERSAPVAISMDLIAESSDVSWAFRVLDDLLKGDGICALRIISFPELRADFLFVQKFIRQEDNQLSEEKDEKYYISLHSEKIMQETEFKVEISEIIKKVFQSTTEFVSTDPIDFKSLLRNVSLYEEAYKFDI